MDHEQVREQLDLAAVERGGLDRLMAGDTAAAIGVAGHLAGCPECTEEFGRLRRAAFILRDVVATLPPPTLREETMAYVAALGRPRVASAIAYSPATAGVTRNVGRPRPTRLVWLALAASIVIVSSAGTGLVVASLKDTAARQASRQLEGLADVATWTLRLAAQPGVQRVELVTSIPGVDAGTRGMLTFSSHTHQLVVVAQGLPGAGAGQEYRCWVEIGGTRQRLGRMYASGDLAYWVGDAPVLGNVPAGSLFGVSLADVSSQGGAGPAILSGVAQS